MCNPVVIPMIIGGIASAVSTSLQVASTKMKADQEQANAEKNARSSMYQRLDVINRAGMAAGETRSAGEKVAGQARAAVSVGGLENSGSLANRITESGVNAEIDVDKIRAQAARQAWGFESEASQYQISARRIKEAGIIGAVGQGVTGGLNLAAQITGRAI